LRVLKQAKIKNDNKLKSSEENMLLEAESDGNKSSTKSKKSKKRGELKNKQKTMSNVSLSEKEYDAKIKNAFMWNLGRS